MKHTYTLTGMTCEGCEAKVSYQLKQVPHVTAVEVSREDQTATITMDEHIALATFQQVLDEKYQISLVQPIVEPEKKSSWIVTYKPVLLIFLYISVATTLIQFQQTQFDVMEWMRHFMAAFFLVFSFFKLLNLKDFASSYAMYDIVAKKFPAWGFAYAFVELALGLAYLVDFQPFYTNLVTAIVMTVSIIGVLETVFNKKTIRCACLGAVFNLPMSTITIIEDGLMIAMSVAMLFIL